MSGRFRATPAKRRKPQMIQTTLDMFRKTAEEIVKERHAPGFVEPDVELSEKKKKQHAKLTKLWANFLQENGLPLSIMNNRSFELMVEAIAQHGPGFVCPSEEELRGPFFEKQMDWVVELRKKHERAWEVHGCTLMVDSWTDNLRNLHLLSFMVGSVEGIFFLGSADASYLSDYEDLADLIEDRIEAIGRERVVQVVSDNSHKLKAACRLLMERNPTLFWTPCAFQCLDLMLKDIGRLEEFKKHIQQAKRVTTFVYRHHRFLCAMCDKIGRKELVVPATTRYSTSFLTLERMYKHRDVLKFLFSDVDWSKSKLSSTKTGANVREIVLSPAFWNGVEECIKASEPLLAVLRMVYGGVRPAMPDVFAGLNLAKKKISDSFSCSPVILKKIIDIIELHWADQMEQKLYEAALFLNPNKYFDIKENDHAYASRLRVMFNDVIEKIIIDDDNLISKVSDLADQYEGAESCFGKKLPMLQRKKKSPNDWWTAYGGSAGELQKFAWRITGLYCSASAYDRNWTMFECINTTFINQSERKRLEDYAYIRYNRMMANRSERQRSEGSKFDPLILEDCELEYDWVGMYAELFNRDDLPWQLVEEVTNGSYTLEDHYRLRKNFCEMMNCEQESPTSRFTDDTGSDTEEENDSFVLDDEDIEDDYRQQDPPIPSDNESDERSANVVRMVDPFDMDEFLKDLSW